MTFCNLFIFPEKICHIYFNCDCAKFLLWSKTSRTFFTLAAHLVQLYNHCFIIFMKLIESYKSRRPVENKKLFFFCTKQASIVFGIL